jgi:hypothetical protein
LIAADPSVGRVRRWVVGVWVIIGPVFGPGMHQSRRFFQ